MRLGNGKFHYQSPKRPNLFRNLSCESFGEGVVHGVHLLRDVHAHDRVEKVEQVWNYIIKICQLNGLIWHCSYNKTDSSKV